MNKWHWDNRERMIVSGDNYLSTEDFIMYTNGLERGLKYSRQLAKLVTPGLASLLEYLADGIDCLAPVERGVPTPTKTDTAHALAARIREALALEANDA